MENFELNLTDSRILCSGDLHVLEMDGVLPGVLGYEQEELLAQVRDSAYMLFPEPERGSIRDHVEQRLKQQLPCSFECGLIHKNGSVVQVSVAVCPGETVTVMVHPIAAWKKLLSPYNARLEQLTEKANRDSLTGLYNYHAGKELINEYLEKKDPYATCGLMLLDIDHFKTVNDTHGHLFGNEVLTELTRLLLQLFDCKDVLMRAGGDEFVVFLKDIGHNMLIRKTMQLVESVRELEFSVKEMSITCSVGVCFLPENCLGYTFNQLFENADWALYQTKNNGRDGYCFCDHLQRFEEMTTDTGKDREGGIAESSRGDIINTAFSIFEKRSHFDSAIAQLLKVVGNQFRLDRITIIATNLRENTSERQYQWTADGVSQTLNAPGSFKKEDFLTLFNSYDEYGTVVLHHDNMEMYSPEGRALLMQGEAKTVVYAAMYCAGQYTGAISYVVCDSKRYWSKHRLSQLGELTKIISAHMSKGDEEALKVSQLYSRYDSLTGLLSFSRFREEMERVILRGEGQSYILVYSDIEDFSYFNRIYGYEEGDELLKQFGKYIIDTMDNTSTAYFSRVVADQFLLFMPYNKTLEEAEKAVLRINEEFCLRQMKRYPNMRIRVRSGIYRVELDCVSASAAIDAANYARLQAKKDKHSPVKCYDGRMAQKQSSESEIVYGMEGAIQRGEFKVYFQPKYSLKTGEITGAEALIRWEREDGTILMPDDFIPLYEQNGQIRELDFYVFEQVVRFLAESKEKGFVPLHVSVNASVLNVVKEDTFSRYADILQKYAVDPSLIEVELSESISYSGYENVRSMYEQVHKAGMKAVLDRFGAGYSILNAVADLHLETIKIDRSLLHNCMAGRRGKLFLQHMIFMIKGLGYRVVCGGVETQEQADALREAGCDEAQGFWFAKPMPVEELERLVFKK